MKTYSDKEKLDLLDRMEKEFLESENIRALEKIPWYVKNASELDQFVSFCPIVLILAAAFLCHMDFSAVVLIISYLVMSIITVIVFGTLTWFDLRKKFYYDAIYSRDRMIEDFSIMRNVILQPDESPYYYFDEQLEDTGIIAYFEKQYSVNHPSETDRAIFAEILMDASEKIHRLAQESLADEKEERNRFVVSFVNK